MNPQSKTFFKAVICNFVLATQLIFINQAQSAGPVGKIDDVDFSFEGVFGTYDKKQLHLLIENQKMWSQQKNEPFIRA